jgi:dihydroorotate dehydrogenase (NAD+) catalytic subunit
MVHATIEKNMPKLRIQLPGLECASPVFTASGTFGYGEEFEDFVDFSRLGGIVVKSVSVEPRVGNRPQRIFETPSGMLNAIGLQNVGLQEFIDKKLPVLQRYPTRIVVNIAGKGVDDYVRVAEALTGRQGVDCFELNLSCPNVKEGLQFCESTASIENVVRSVRKVTTLPLWVKLSPNVADNAPLAKAAEAAGADAISAINTLRGVGIDLKTRKPVLGNLSGGLSGPAIKPVALFHVWQIYRAVKIPVIGIGGICQAEDVLEFILAGASAIQVGCANFRDPDVTMTLIDGLEDYLEKHHVNHIWDLRGEAWR